jgi:DNA-binding HxlR family transcriptional regulator
MRVSPAPAPDPGDPFTADCPGRSVFETITGRWGLLVLLAMRDGPLRFHRLRDHVQGVSERMLSKTLKALCADGLVDRTVEPSVPPKVTYALTPVGAELAEVMSGVLGWIGRRLPEIERARARAAASGPLP